VDRSLRLDYPRHVRKRRSKEQNRFICRLVFPFVKFNGEIVSDAERKLALGLEACQAECLGGTRSIDGKNCQNRKVLHAENSHCQSNHQDDARGRSESSLRNNGEWPARKIPGASCASDRVWQ
jgi:hypothetical protein